MSLEELQIMCEERKQKFFLREQQLEVMLEQVEDVNQKLIDAYDTREEIFEHRQVVEIRLQNAEDRFKEQMEK